jgi:hypothetical protein
MTTSYLIINPDKMAAKQPDLVGTVQVDNDAYRVALWAKRTQDDTRDYYTGFIGEDEKDAPQTKLKIYQFRKAKAEDPDFYTPQPFELAGTLRYAYLSIVPDPDRNEDFLFPFEVETELRRQKETNEMRSFKDRIKKYASAKPAVKYDENGEPDEIPFRTTIYRDVRNNKLNRAVL